MGLLRDLIDYTSCQQRYAAVNPPLTTAWADKGAIRDRTAGRLTGSISEPFLLQPDSVFEIFSLATRLLNSCLHRLWRHIA